MGAADKVQSAGYIYAIDVILTASCARICQQWFGHRSSWRRHVASALTFTVYTCYKYLVTESHVWKCTILSNSQWAPEINPEPITGLSLGESGALYTVHQGRSRGGQDSTVHVDTGPVQTMPWHRYVERHNGIVSWTFQSPLYGNAVATMQ